MRVAVIERTGRLTRALAIIAFAVVALAGVGCLVSSRVRPPLDPPTEVEIARLWEDPVNLAARNLFYGPGGQSLVPATSTAFTFLAADRSGYSAGYDVRGSDGMEWSVKVGPEAQPEVAVSRILWALGYHQPPTYYVTSWTMTGAQSGVQMGARFRPRLPDRKAIGDWSWYENDFINTEPFKRLIVANVMLNNWDWKTSNNKIYEIAARDGRPSERVYVVQDLGASLGKTSYPKVLSWLPMRGLGQGSRNDLEGFEAQGFIKHVEGERVDFHYRGIHRSLIDTLTTRNVVETSRLMARLSDTQWNDAFRAAGYTNEQSRRYVAKIKSKVAEGLNLAEGYVQR